MSFLYVLSGWEGSAADTRVYYNTQIRNFNIPPGKYYLADTGFGACDELLVQYCNVRYHLAEWGRGHLKYVLKLKFSHFHTDISRPCNHKELFNLHHAMLWNVIEHIFSVLKNHFRILALPPFTRMT